MDIKSYTIYRAPDKMRVDWNFSSKTSKRYNFVSGTSVSTGEWGESAQYSSDSWDLGFATAVVKKRAMCHWFGRSGQSSRWGL